MATNILKAAFIATALVGATAHSSHAQITADDLKKRSPSTQGKTSCISLDDAETLLKVFDERETYMTIFREAKGTRNTACIAKLKEAGDLMIDLLIGVVTLDEQAVCEATSSNDRKELVLKLHQLSYAGTPGKRCRTLTK